MITDQQFTSLCDVSWGGPSAPAYDGYLSAAPVPPPGTESGTPPTTASPAPPTGAPATPASGPGTPSNEDNLRVMREGYNTYKGWQGKLGNDKFEDVHQSHQTFSQLRTEAVSVGTKLGYTPEDIAESFKNDPVGTLAIIRQEQRRQAKAAPQGGQPNPNGNLREEILKQVREEMKPVLDHANKEATDRANSLFESTTNGLIDAEFKELKGNPEFADAYNMIFDITSTMIQADPEALVAIKSKGDTQAIKKYFASAKDMFVRSFTAYQKYTTRTSAPPTPGGTTLPGGRPASGPKPDKLTLEQIINGDDAAKKHIKSFQ